MADREVLCRGCGAFIHVGKVGRDRRFCDECNPRKLKPRRVQFRSRSQRSIWNLAGTACGHCGVVIPSKSDEIARGRHKRMHPECVREREARRCATKGHIRRVLSRVLESSLTPDEEERIRTSATNCALCKCSLADVVAHLDHVLPIGIGGAHHPDNVRMLCQACNLSRPKDGSDVLDQPMLWQLHGLSIEDAERAIEERETMAASLAAEADLERVERGGRAREAAEKREALAFRAASMRESGQGWREITLACGYSSTGTAFSAVKRVRPDLVGSRGAMMTRRKLVSHA